MCGILGIVNSKADFEPHLAAEDVARLRHRGPDGFGICDLPHVSLGHARLSILDLSARGSQPMTSHDGRYTVVHNGEIYNFLELREELQGQGYMFSGGSDTEVLLGAYAVWGRDCLEHFDGMFAFALWDRETRCLFMARDRCGEKPFFYWMDGDAFIFASELKALLPLLPVRPELDAAVADMYLHYQYVPEPFTLLKGVHKLPAAHCMTLDVAAWHAIPFKYWSLEDIQPMEGQPAEVIHDALERAIRLTLRSDVPVGVALSGGIDSGGIAALAARHTSAPLHAFSVGYPGRPEYDEREQAKALALRLGMFFHEVEIPVHDFIDFFPTLVRILDEPVADPAAFGHFAVPKAAANMGIKVLLSGIGGDELFWGYDWVRQAAAVNIAFLSRDNTGLMSRFASFLPPRLRQRLSRFRLLPASLREACNGLAVMDARTPSDQLCFLGATADFSAAFTLKNRFCGPAILGIPDGNVFRPTTGMPETPDAVPTTILRLLFGTWLVSNCLTLGDRVSMAAGVETRMPFLDRGLVECVMGLRRVMPDQMLPHKAWLRQALRNLVPDEVLNRPKRGFQPPVQMWLKGVLDSYGACLPEGKLASEGIVDVGAIRSLIGGKGPLGWPVLFFAYKLLLLEMWSDSFYKTSEC